MKFVVKWPDFVGFERLVRPPSSRVIVSLEKVRPVNHKDRRRAMNEVYNILGLCTVHASFLYCKICI